jgi:hypothetical protein
MSNNKKAITYMTTKKKTKINLYENKTTFNGI